MDVRTNRRKLKQILALMERAYGARPWQRWGNGVSVLIETILSQNTSAANSTAGYKRLWRAFRSWNKVADAPVEQIEKPIRISGLSRIKAPRMQRILQQLRAERGKIDLEFLQGWDPQQAYHYLMQFDGVGPKTANCVLLFSFGMPLFPVDTHIHRITQRLGLIPAKATADQAHDLLAPLIAPGDRYAMHILLIAHGRQVCRARNPQCTSCPLLALCPHARRLLGARPCFQR